MNKDKRLDKLVGNQEVYFPLVHLYKTYGLVPYMYRHWKLLEGESYMTKEMEEKVNVLGGMKNYER